MTKRVMSDVAFFTIMLIFGVNVGLLAWMERGKE